MAATPICRCRVLYLGSAVPHASKDGLQGIQGPLRELYPEGGARGARGIDSWLSVWSNGLLLENVDEHRHEVTRFFPISSLHYCAAVRHVLVPERGVGNGHGPTPGGGGGGGGAGAQPRFLPLDSPFAAAPSAVHPPLFAAILRRTTGIKVLECHVFICKREAAANALVRCCFHAYADSSYAKHIDGGGGGENGSPESIYGTLRGENWRRASTTSLSNGHGHHTNGTIDFDSNDGEVDDGSVYNGDENHKVWAGREDEDKDNGGGIYGYGGSSAGTTLRSRGRNARPRQVTEPVPPPPPPPPTSTTPTKSDKKERTKMREMYPPRQGRPRSAMSLGMHQIHHPMPMAIPPHPGVMMTLPPPGRMFVQMGAPMGAPMGPPMGAPPGRRGPPGPPNARFMLAPPHPPPLPPPQFVATLGRRRIAAEEPVYMPSARPLSPVASYQPGHFPHDAYLMGHYATATLDGRGKKKNKKGKKNGMPMPVPIPVPMLIPPPPPPSQLNGAAVPAGVGNANNNHANHANHANHDDSSGENSPSGTGIYRKKGHLNERAFSYSIRQEHRSRSHGSLASLKFAAPNNSATGPSTDHKKEREIVHMMRGLDLMGDDLERSEVPPAVLSAAKQTNSRTLR